MKFFPVFFLLFFASITQAAEIDALYRQIDKNLADPALMKIAVARGKERALVCKYCHGTDGNSKRDYIPNLAEQSPKYLLHQFELFASKQRNDRIMSELTNNLTTEDRLNIALFYAAQKALPRFVFKPELKARGERIFKSRCVSCHGEKGYGGELLPRIASQPGEYLQRTLLSYQRNSHRRPDSPMQAVAAQLNEAELEAVIAHVSAMP